MSQNKKQHFVPKLILRNFCSASETSINLFNLKLCKNILDASITNQCYKPFFYGKDLIVENVMGEVEARFNGILKTIIEEKSLFPPLYLFNYQFFCFFIYLQKIRTEESENYIDEVKKELMNNVLEKYGEKIGKNLSNIEFDFKNSIYNSLRTINNYKLILDLKPVLIVNNTRREFIIGEQPVVEYNLLLKKFKSGTNSMGCSLFFPITPRLLILMYDENVYNINNIKNSVVEINQENEIKKINGLQWVSTKNNIFYSSYHMKSIIASEFDFFKKFRNEKRVKLEEYGAENEKLIHISENIHFKNFNFSFFSLNKRGKKFQNKKQMDIKKGVPRKSFYSRNEELMQSVQFEDLININPIFVLKDPKKFIDDNIL